ncbi:MAG: DUF4405 domain-containing protein [Chloroflexota bacterium]
MQQPAKKSTSLTQFKLILDLLVLALFITVNAPQLTGLAGHEWVSFVFAAPFLVHLILNWKWIVSVMSRIFKKLPGETRFNQIWDMLLFTMMTLVIFSGTIVSEKALPALNIHIEIDPFWRSIHTTFANLLLLMFGVHITMHWKWLVSNFRRYVLQTN